MLNTRIHTRLERLGLGLQAVLEKAGLMIPGAAFMGDPEVGSNWWLLNQAERDPELAVYLRREGILPPQWREDDDLRGLRS